MPKWYKLWKSSKLHCPASNKRKRFHQKFKFSHWFGYGDHRHQACTWRTQNLCQSLEPSQCKLLSKMARHDQKRICWHEQATGMVQDKQKSYAPQLKMCKKQVGLQDLMQHCIPGASCCMLVQSGTWHWFFWKLLFGSQQHDFLHSASDGTTFWLFI